jgi:murein DD-endopeptidase MepM/ murein hydrolase activator NlpD
MTWVEQIIALEAEKRALRDQSAGLDAHLATASYDAQLSILNRELAEAQTALGGLEGIWGEWGSNAQAAIVAASKQARQAYRKYKQLVAAGYDQYMAAITSRYSEYMGQVTSMTDEYLATTNQSYGDFMKSLPPMFQGAIDATYTGDAAAIDALEAREAEALSTIEGQLLASTESFGAEMARIGADNPALAAELLADLRSVVDLTSQAIGLEGDHSQAIALAAGSVARTAAQYGLAINLRQNEQARVEYVNDAARQRRQLLDQAEANQASQLEHAGAARAQALIDIQYNLDQRLADLDSAAAELRLQAASGAQQMSYELQQQIQDLIDRGLITATNRYVAGTQAGRPGQTTLLSQTDFALSAATAALQAFGLDQHDYERVLGNVADLYAQGGGTLLDRWTSQILTASEYQILGQLQQSLGIPDSELGAYAAAVKAYQQGVDSYHSDYLPSMQAGQGGGGGGIMDPDVYQINSGGFFGTRPNATGGTGTQFHSGVDLHAPTGTSIYTPRNGVLTRYNNDEAGYGVQITFDDGTYLRYAHINYWNAVPPNGTQVTAGQLIAQVGGTGNANAPHLHLSYWVNGQAVDPIAAGFIPAPGGS